MNRIGFLAMTLVACETVDAGKYAPPTGDPTPWEEDTGEPETDEDPCADVPIVNWDNFGRGFFRESCQGCHSSAVSYRYGAPEDINFDSLEDVWSNPGWVLAVAGGEDPSMPPQGGTTDADRERLYVWLTCAPEGT